MKRTYKKLICVILSAVLLLSALPLTVHAAAKTYSVSTPQELKAAVDEINGAGAGDYIISLADDIERGYLVINNSDVTVTIIGNGHTINTSDGTPVCADKGATVNLGDGNSELIIASDNVCRDDSGMVAVLENSFCNMYDKVTLKDYKCENHIGGGVTVQGGTFHMYGGTIQNCGVAGGSVCYGGGVGVFVGGSFIMDGGIIKDCYTVSSYNGGAIISGCGAGVFVSSIASFTMNGGTISNNTATNTGGGISCGGGVALIISNNEMADYAMGNPQSSVTINGGTITGNKADLGGGVFASGYYRAYGSGAGTATPGGGTPKDPGLYINGGEISENEAGEGGGIFAMCLCPWGRKSGVKGSKTQIHNATIINNTADSGAGIESYAYWTQMDIDGCTISGNKADSIGGGIALLGNSSSGLTKLKNTTVTGNTSGDIGAGVLYDADSLLYISGADIIQDNTFNGKLNNLNIYMEDGTIYPVYVNGDLTGSQIGLSDPTLWDDGKEDYDPAAVSTDYLTSGYKANNSADPGTAFTSDHETWIADFSDVNTNEVRLVRKTTVDYHINNKTIADAKYDGEDIFTTYVEDSTGKEITIGDTINAFYTVPEVKPTAQNSCPYIFKGWYYDKVNNNDTRPVNFRTDKYIAGRDIYAHWIEVKNVAKDGKDEYNLPGGETEYGGFDLTGVQVRNRVYDTNFGNELKPGGLRFMTSLSMDVVNQINAIQDDNIEYGYVAATRADWINAHQQKGDKLQYVSATANGKNTSTYNEERPQDYFGFAKNVVCTSNKTNTGGVVKEDHRNFKDYLLYTLVITYTSGKELGENVLARPYIKYTDANGLERVAYSEYRGSSNTLGGCYTSYNAVAPTP